MEGPCKVIFLIDYQCVEFIESFHEACAWGSDDEERSSVPFLRRCEDQFTVSLLMEGVLR